MNPLVERVLKGAAVGFAVMFAKDIDSWAKAPAGAAFDWGIASKRWVAGAIAGAITALGLDGVNVAGLG